MTDLSAAEGPADEPPPDVHAVAATRRDPPLRLHELRLARLSGPYAAT